MANKTITAPKGFLAAGLHCGIKASGRPDLALLYCPAGAAAAAVFTTNKIVSAAVTVCREHARSARTFAAVINSGNANACTGQKGIADAEKMCQTSAEHLHIHPEQVLIASTGIIGHPLPIQTVCEGIRKAADRLGNGVGAGMNFARAILTTDTKVKNAVRTVNLNGKTVTLAGTVKGAGMIGPNMATTLCILTTDAAIRKPLLQKALRTAVDQSLNRLTVDGHQSTNDTAMILASGLAGNRMIQKQDGAYRRFETALTELCLDLARQMALDAEGATRMFTVVIEGAASAAEARQAARAVANYDLVKCAVHGADPNWGRIICAVGSSGVRLNPEKLTCKIGQITVFRNGQPARFDPKKVSRIIAQKEHTITVYLGAGIYSDFCMGCDLSREYITINADYHT
ncbi:MAG TPA: bifunctional glutamate N-acetyltransferase/amino-acid acetyltransferase ArgJ [Anaerohalosphaeraceae bacterium]|nr:bifunctional glutamate N-acetyltransferase/amino-acid acetyltransferase ArgJ [Anaerohalosphaeraceae bacterium]